MGLKRKKKKEEGNIETKVLKKAGKDYADGSVRGILKSVTWPPFPTAARYTVSCIAGSAAAAAALYAFGSLVSLALNQFL